MSERSAFDPQLWVNDPSGCTIGAADDSFPCTFPPPTYACPGLILDDLEVGVYEVVVHSYGDCSGTSADYSLQVDVTVPA